MVNIEDQLDSQLQALTVRQDHTVPEKPLHQHKMLVYQDTIVQKELITQFTVLLELTILEPLEQLLVIVLLVQLENTAQILQQLLHLLAQTVLQGMNALVVQEPNTQSIKLLASYEI